MKRPARMIATAADTTAATIGETSKEASSLHVWPLTTILPM
jgi:hypothetical protein